MFAVILWLLLCHRISASSKISHEEFSLFPPFRHLDRFSQCVQSAGGAYCVANADLVAERPNQLLDAMKNFSYSAIRHLDYTKVRYGYCITRRCKEFYTGRSDEALMAAMGACLNHTLEREYGLRARVAYGTCYSHHEQKYPVTGLDRAAAALYATITLLVVAGTLYDLFATKKNPQGYLMCFSVAANWAKLTAPWPQNDAAARLMGINGIRSIVSITTIVVHSIIPLASAIENPYAVEQILESASFQFVTHAHILVQTFLFLSGMFLAYTSQVSGQGSRLAWRSLPKAMLLRWLRLAPVYLLMALYTATWFKFVPYGPLWQEMVEDEYHACRRDWLSVLLLYNNYVRGSYCNPHHWSTAADMHLYLLGLMVLTLPARGLALAATLALGALLPAAETYWRALDGAFVTSGQVVHNLRVFNNYDTFNYLYKRTHTNMPAFFTGMVFGLYLYQWMKKPLDEAKCKKYAWGCWLSLPLMLGLVYSHTVLLGAEGARPGGLAGAGGAEGARPGLPLRLLFATLPKLLWGGALSLLVLGLVSRAENVYRPVLEWGGWVLLTRLGFCLYNGHMVVIRWVYATDGQLTYLSGIHLVIKTIGIVAVSYMVALVLYLGVEAPGNNLVKKLFPEKKSTLEVNHLAKKIK